MTNLNYSNYTFFNANKKDNKKDNTNKEDIVEGIANFCKLNRSYNNQRPDLWRFLDAALDKEGQLKDDLLNAINANNGITDANPTGDNIGAIFNETGDKAMEFGKIHIFSSDLKQYFGIKPVDTDGIFRTLPPELTDNPDKYIFAYQDDDGKYWKTIFNKVGENTKEGATSGQTPADNAAIHGFVTSQNLDDDIKSAQSGSDGIGRDGNGKLLNTEFKNSGAELRYNSMKLIYNKSVTNTVLLSVGVIASLYFIAKN
jgi:hypothetical protein